MTTVVTPNINLALPNFNVSPWHDDINDNFRILDAVIASTIGTNNVKGKFVNSTSVIVGEKYYDEVSGDIYTVLISHTTSPIPATFAQDRITNPTYWELFTFLNLGTMATQNANNVNITGGNIFGITASGTELNAAALQSNNRIINGDFAIWQRGSSGSANGYTAADRWINGFIGGTVTQSREVLSFGEKFGVNTPRFILRQSVSGQTLTSHFANTQQRIEGVRSYAGETITILGWARRAAGSGNMAVQIRQVFGTGGSPSADVTVAASSQVVLESAWQPFAVTLAVPSIVGKTNGTNDDDYLQLTFFTSAGTDYTLTTAALGLQNITVDLWGVHIRIGTFAASDAEDYIAPGIGENLRNCQRFFEKCFVLYEGYQLADVIVSYSAPFKVTKRTTPTIAITNEGSVNLTGTFTVPSVNQESTMIRDTKNSSTGYFAFLVSITAEAEL